MSERLSRALRWLVRLGLAGLLVYAGALKLVDLSGFADDIDHYRLLPQALVGPLALALPVFEVITGAALLTSTYMRGAAVLCAAMLASFGLAMAQAKLRGIDLACGCFGAGVQAQVSWVKVTIDLVLAMLAIWLILPGETPATPHARAAPSAGRS